jgi:Ca2+-binding RTX toxin-like protein
LAFTTIPGGNGVDLYFEGKADKDDILLTLNESGTILAKGLSGNDTMTFVNTTGVVGTVTAMGAAGNDLFVFTQDAANADDARIYNSSITGADGNDTFNISGGAWTSTVLGGAGEDSFLLGTNYTLATIKGGAGNDAFTRQNNLTLPGVFAGAVATRANATVLELDNTKIRGQGDNDRAMDFRNFIISSDDSTINGNGGNDLLQFGLFDTVDGLLIAGGANDDDINAELDPSAPDGIVFNGGSGIDSIIASTGDDVINGGSDADTIFGRAGTDTIDAGTGADFADGEGGNDTIAGGTGNDTLLGNGGNDVINGNENNDQLDGGAGDDTIAGDAGNDAIDGNIGRDSLSGNEGRDTILDGTGADTIVGGNGGDTITIDNIDDGVVNTAAQILTANSLVDDVYVLNAITDSNASSPTAATNAYDVVTGFSVIGTGSVVGGNVDYTSGTQIDFTAIANDLAGTVAARINFTDVTAALAAVALPAVKDSFADLVTAFNTPGAPLMQASSANVDGTIEAYVFTHDMDGAGTGAASTYLIINDTAAQLTGGDVMIDFGDQSADMTGFINQLGASIEEGTNLTA